jgi:hypothetical protein
LTATVSSEIFKAAQPALLYLVPFTLLPLLTMAYLKVSFVFSGIFIRKSLLLTCIDNFLLDTNRSSLKFNLDY